jgi:hypothetical protein
VILNDNDSNDEEAGDEPEGASGNVDVDMGRIERDASPHHTFATSESASAPTEFMDVSGPWYDFEDGRYIEESSLDLRPSEQYSAPCTAAQAPPQTFP